jgi:hypothetical protein
MSQPYDSVNQKAYEYNTELLVNALGTIEKDTTQSATIANLAILTGIHRNTISERKWPKDKLEEIKTDRKNKLSQPPKNEVKLEKILGEKLENAKHELVYWFNLSNDLKKETTQLNINLSRMSDARIDYERMLILEREKTKKLQNDIQKLKELLSSMMSNAKNN